MTESKLQSLLAAQLPDLIGGTECFVWLDANCAVTPREWDWIVRQIVARMSAVEFRKYILLLKENNHLVPRNAQLMSWQQRGTCALQVIGVIK